MLRSVKELMSYAIRTYDGQLGYVYDFYFDDETWRVRYVVMDTGAWLPGRRVLLPTSVVDEPERGAKTLSAALSKAQIKTSPEAETDKPVSKQKEGKGPAHAGLTPYWAILVADPMIGAAAVTAEAGNGSEGDEEGDPHLRSLGECLGYQIEARDGLIGQVHDVIAEIGAWPIRYLVVSLEDRPLGKKVLVPTDSADGVNWGDRKVTIDLTVEKIKNGPEFDASDPVNRELEVHVYDYYGRAKYWQSP